MKTYKNLHPQIYTFENLHTAYRRARAGKRSRVDVAAGDKRHPYEFDMEHNLLQLQRELHDQTYRPGPYHNFTIREPKRRLVSAAPFRDRVVHRCYARTLISWVLAFWRGSSRGRLPSSHPRGIGAEIDSLARMELTYR